MNKAFWSMGIPRDIISYYQNICVFISLVGVPFVIAPKMLSERPKCDIVKNDLLGT